MPEVKNSLKRENIKIKKISEYSVIELCDIANFFKKIGICNLDDEFVLTYIFSNINIVIENPIITQSDIAEKLKMSRQSVSINIRELKDKNILERVGSNKKGFWKILIDLQ